MHEAIVSRGDVRGVPRLKDHIFTQENCVLLHHECHMMHGETTETRRKCIEQLLTYEGLDTILVWLDQLAGLSKSNLVDERRREVLAIVEGTNGEVSEQAVEDGPDRTGSGSDE